MDRIALHGTVLAFAAALSLLTGLLFGLVPALRTQPLQRRNRGARWLVAVEVALALVLLQSSGLLLESFRRAWHTDLGFQKEQVLTARLDLTKRSYPNGNRVRAFREELLSRVAALPGVQYAGTVSSLPMGIIGQGTEFEVGGRPETAQQKPFATYANISTDYLRAMRIPLVSGRYFERADGPGSPPVTIVSESLARAWWPAGAALGKHIRFDDTWFTIVGVVKDVRQASPEQAAAGHIYALNQQLPLASQGAAMGRFNILVIRTAGDMGALSAAVRRPSPKSIRISRWPKSLPWPALSGPGSNRAASTRCWWASSPASPWGWPLWARSVWHRMPSRGEPGRSAFAWRSAPPRPQ